MKIQVIIEKHKMNTSRWAVKSKGDLWRDKEKWHHFFDGRLFPSKKSALSVFKRFVDTFDKDYEIELIN